MSNVKKMMQKKLIQISVLKYFKYSAYGFFMLEFVVVLGVLSISLLLLGRLSSAARHAWQQSSDRSRILDRLIEASNRRVERDQAAVRLRFSAEATHAWQRRWGGILPLESLPLVLAAGQHGGKIQLLSVYPAGRR